jgi:acyl-CoA synthetase (AMP-forming)/AMP-acid ligase II
VAADSDQGVVAWRAAVTGPRFVHALLDGPVRRTPERTAVREADRAWSYRRLWTASHAFAGWLRRAGVRAGDRVVVHESNRAEVVAAVYGASLAGAVLVPVGGDAKPFQLAGIVADCEPAVVLSCDPTGAAVPAAEVWRELDRTPEAPQVDGTPSEPAMLIYTSGSTAQPKGVVCPHDSVLFAVRAIGERLRYRQTDTVFLRLPLSFDYGLYQAFLCAAAGAALYIATPGSTGTVLREVRDSGATVVPVVPQLALMLCQLAERTGPRPGVRLFTNTGAALTPAAAGRLRAAFPGASVVSMYGLTECKRVSVGDPDGDLDRPGSVGRPLPGTRVRIEDEDGSPVPAGRVGQIVVTGPHVMAGYYRAPGPTAQRFGIDGAGRGAGSVDGSVDGSVAGSVDGVRTLRTGDHGWLDADGYLYFDTRRDDIFKRRGVRMSTPEIEAAAHDVDGVEAAAAIPLAGPPERLYVVVTGAVDPAAVLEGIAARLDPARVPDRCLVLDRLPLTPAGKVDRGRLRTLVEAAR